MYKHARSARTHKTHRLFSVVAVLLAAAFLFGVSFAAALSGPAFAAPINPFTGTLLESGSGLVIGTNPVRTSGGNSDSQSYSSENPLEANLYGSDFWFDYGTAGNFNTTHPMGIPNVASFSGAMMSLTYYTLPTSEMTNANDLYFRSRIKVDENGAVYSNLNNAQSTVTFAVSAEVRASVGADGYADRLSLDWFFSDNGVDSNVRGTTGHEATGDWETVTSRATVDRVTASSMNLNDKAYFQINIGGFITEGADTAQSGGGISGPTTGIMVDIRNVTVTVTVSTDETLMAYGPLGVRVEGGTRSVRRPDAGSIYVQNLNENTEFYADGINYKYGDTYPYSLISLNQNRVYVKFHDSVFLYSDVQIGGAQMAIAPDYAESMGAETGTMPINWIYGSDSEYQLFNSFDYRKPSEQSSMDVKNGRTTELYYNKDNSLNGRSITLRPQFITGVQMGNADEKPVFSYLAASSVTLTFDNVSPSNIAFSGTDGGVGQYGASTPEEALAKPFTSSTIVPFRFASGRPQSPSDGNDIAPETLYYTLTAAGEDAEGPLTNPNRQVAAVGQNGEGRIEFPSGRGTEAFKLQMVVVDAAGNYSEVYTRYICVDTNHYNVSVNFQKGTTGSNILMPGTTAANEIAAIRFFDGSLNRWLSGSSTGASFGRMAGFSMQIRMNRVQYEKYKLVSVRNASSDYDKGIFIDEESLRRPIADPDNWSSLRPQIGFHVEGSGNSTFYTYTVTYVMASYGNVEMDDPNTIGTENRTFDFLTTDAARNFTFSFKERAEATVSLTAPEFKFEEIQGVPTAVPQGLRVSFNNFNNIDYQVKYYRLTQEAIAAGRTIGGLINLYSVPQDAAAQGLVELIGSDDAPGLPSLAGEYWYWIYIPEGSATGHDRNYYIDKGGLFAIQKAYPKVEGVAFVDEDGRTFRLVYSTGGGMRTILDRNLIKGIGPNGSYSHNYSSVGVPGYYEIKSPTPTSLNYQNPAAGQYTVTVAFNPANVGGILSSDNFRSSEDIMLELTVVPYEVQFRAAEGQPLTAVYNKDGLPQPFAVEVSFDNENWLTEEEARIIDPAFLLDYQYKPEGQTAFTGTVPTNAGSYDVRVSVDRAVANYQGTFTLSEAEGEFYIIEKERLNIEYEFAESYVYSYFTAPTLRAFRWFDPEETQPEWVDRNLRFEVTYKKAGDAEFTLDTPYTAGEYLARVRIVAVNYEGETAEEIRFTVRKANAENTNGRLNANFPMAMSSVKSETGAHAVYGDRLGDVRLATGNAYNVTYTLGGQSRPSVVSGTFRFAESPEEYGSLGLSEAVSAELRTHLNTPFDTVGKKTVIIVFVPDDRANYDVLFRTVDITIDRAKPMYDELRFGEIVYGQTFSEAVLFGDLYLNVAIYDPNDTSVLSRKETVLGEIRYLNAQPSVVYPVGQTEILAEFIPSGASSEKFYGIEFSITLGVAKQPAEITADGVITVEYGSLSTLDGKASVNIAGETLLYRVFRTTSADTDTEITADVLGEELRFSRTTAAGLYAAEIYIGENSNYSAGKFVYLRIEKSSPNVVQRSEIVDFEIGNDVYSYQDEKGWDGFVLAIHADAAFGETVEGTLRLASGQTAVYGAAGRYAYTFIFRPTGAFAENYSETEVELYVAVSKRTVGLTVAQDGMSKVYTGSALYPTVIIDTEELTEDDLVWSVAPVIAGRYSLTVRISDENDRFRGSLEIIGFIITKDTEAELEIAEDRTAWTGEDVFADGAFTLSAESGIPTEYSISYYDYIGNQVQAMTDVGRYEVRITLAGNYEGTLRFDFFVIPAEVTYEDVEDGAIVRVYNPESTMTGRVAVSEVIPMSAASAGTVEYAPLTPGGEFAGEYEQTVPYLAGRYSVRTRFNVNGYNGSDGGIIMVIEKAQTEVTRAPAAEYVYSGNAPEIEIAFRQIGLDYTLEYSANGGEFYSDEPNIAAGDGYSVRITVADGNYQGVFIYPYIIKKGEVSLVGTVTLEAAPYGTALDELSAEELTQKFGYDGAFMFGNAYVSGTFALSTSGIASLPVWQYDVNYVFTPSDPSLEEYHGAVNLNIVRRNISEWLEIDETSLTAYYDGRQKTVAVSFKEEYASHLTASVKNGVLSSVNVIYSGLSSTPLNAGSYDFTVTLGHVNYSAYLTGRLEIEKATPAIVAPDPVATLASAVTLNRNGIIRGSDDTEINLNTIGSVYAIISSNGVPVSGTFAIDTTDGTEISGANRKAVKTTFTPDDADNFNAVETEIYIMLRKAGAEVGISGVTLPNIPVYGKTLGEAYDLAADVTVSGSWAAAYATYGSFRFENADFVPSVGSGTVKLIFEVNGAYVDSYNNKEFDVTVTVENKAAVTIAGDVYFDVRLGDVYGSGKFALPEDYAYLADFGTFSLSEKAGDTVNRADITATAVIGYTYQSANYTVSRGNAKVKLLILPEEFSISNNRTEYRGGAPIEKYELFGLTGISVPNIDSVSGGFVFRIFKDGAEVDVMSDAGVYTVIASVNRTVGIGAGEVSFEFTVTPMDLSAFIELNGGAESISTVYLSGVQLFPSLTGQAADIENIEFLFYYKKAGDGDGQFSIYNRPQNAGDYVLRVTVSGNDFYSGYRDYPYAVEKKEVQFTVGTQVFTYGGAREAEVIVSDGLTRADYELVYRSEDGVVFRTVPTDAGAYTATVTVTNANYCGTYSFAYTVNREKTVVSEWVTLGAIVYGQPVSASQMTLPSVMPTVAGHFELEDPSLVLGAGDRTVRVTYVPDNRNFTTEYYDADIRVNKAQTGLNFDVVGKQYTGQTLYPSVTVPGDAGLAEFVTFAFYRLVDGRYVPTDAPVLPGTYYVRAALEHENYTYSMANGSYLEFNVYRAEVTDCEVPTVSPIAYGKSLEGNSAISGGYAVYYNGTEEGIRVAGTFSFVNGNVSLGDADEENAKIIKLKFTPDSANYEPFECEAAVFVVKATGSIAVSSGNSVVYGNPISYPVLKVAPDTSLRVRYDDGFVDMVGKCYSVGQYTVTARIDDANYTGEITFTYSVTRAPVGLTFLNAEGREVRNYTFEFGDAASKIYASVASGYDVDKDEIAAYFDFSYTSADGALTYDSFERILANAGSYRVTVSVSSGSNYTGSATVEVNVTKRTVDDVMLPVSSLQEQVYGSVSRPTVEIYKNGRILTGVSYYIDYGDSGRVMPARAGTYMIMVVIDDRDYEPYRKQATFVINKKRLTVENISVENKLFDGVPGLKIDGNLAGVLLGDEVTLHLAARVKGGEIDPGTYGVDIVTAELRGLDAGNYSLDTPFYNGTVTVTSNRLHDTADGGSYVIYGDSVSKDAEFSAGTVESPLNKEGFFSSMLGQKADVISFSIRENGIKTELSAPVKVYIKIPERFRNSENVTVEGLGNLAGAGISFSREGDYITFYTTVSGEIIITVNDFPYGILFIGIAFLVLILGFIAIRLLDPARHKLGVRNHHRYDAVKAETARYKELKREAESKPPAAVEKSAPKRKKKK